MLAVVAEIITTSFTKPEPGVVAYEVYCIYSCVESQMVECIGLNYYIIVFNICSLVGVGVGIQLGAEKQLVFKNILVLLALFFMRYYRVFKREYASCF